MVLAAHGADISEAELITLCDCTFDGTNALKAVDAARQLGFAHSSKYTLSITDLTTLLSQGHFPIAFVEMLPIDGINQVHALVILGISKFSVQVYDPAKGERLIPYDVFHLAWKLRHYLAIVIER